MAGRKAAATVHVIGQVRLRQRGPKSAWHARYMPPAGRKEEFLKVTNLKVAMRKARQIKRFARARGIRHHRKPPCAQKDDLCGLHG